MLLERGIMLKKELPTHCRLWNKDERVKWYDERCPKIFSGNTFTDGSCIPCPQCSELSRAGAGVVCVRDQLFDTQCELDERPDEPNSRRCTCVNAGNKYHKCTEYCADNAGCDKACYNKQHEQKLAKAAPTQALAVALPGPIQTTPRAEVYAILMALVYGVSPQVIICDHDNHVKAICAMEEGNYAVLHPMTPNVDLWRLVVRAIQVRGGLKRSGPQQLWIEWQPAHTRASTNETVDQKNRRRGNASADTFANDGRRLHDDVTNKITRVQWLYHAAKQCATWTGVAAALQYDNNFNGCDHDVKPKDSCRPKRNKPMKVEVPPEARVLRKFPWATRCLGTCEYVEDIHCDDPVEDVPKIARMAGAVRAAAKRTMVGAAYSESFTKTLTSNRYLGKRVHTNTVPEILQPLRKDEAFGHTLHVVGLHPRQYIYCQDCNAYTGTRAVNLMKMCKGYSYPSRAVNRLKEGRHPDDRTLLATQPRRIIRKDVGHHVWNGEVGPSADVYCESVDPDHGCTLDNGGEHAKRLQEEVSCIEHEITSPTHHPCMHDGEEDDPLNLGYELGRAGFLVYSCPVSRIRRGGRSRSAWIKHA